MALYSFARKFITEEKLLQTDALVPELVEFTTVEEFSLKCRYEFEHDNKKWIITLNKGKHICYVDYFSENGDNIDKFDVYRFVIPILLKHISKINRIWEIRFDYIFGINLTNKSKQMKDFLEENEFEYIGSVVSELDQKKSNHLFRRI